MSRLKERWICQQCSTILPRWNGQCPSCQSWHSVVESAPLPGRASPFTKEKARPLHAIEPSSTPRKESAFKEFDRLLGGGLVPGSLILIGGEPGIGKSTLMMQLAASFCMGESKALYVSGEESLDQTAQRARRLAIASQGLLLLSECNFERIEEVISEEKPDLVIIDSVQIVYLSTITSHAGSPLQVREVAQRAMHLAKERNIAIFLIGHVTKSGEIAGPKLLEHLVDSVLYFEGEQHHAYRMIRVQKNRFGPTDEIALFHMSEKGLTEVENPSQIFLKDQCEGCPGSVIAISMEGSRPLAVEVQALVTESYYPSPTRKASGFDPNRLSLIIAVLSKQLKLPLHKQDIFLSIAGGLRIKEPALDLAAACAILSSFTHRPLSTKFCCFGEVTLNGQLRSVPKSEQRLREAGRLGFQKVLIPSSASDGLISPLDIQHGASLKEVMSSLFRG